MKFQQKPKEKKTTTTKNVRQNHTTDPNQKTFQSKRSKTKTKLVCYAIST